MTVKQRLDQIREKIEVAASRAGRNPDEIKLVAVSKKQSLDKIKDVLDEGILDFGESRVQELRDKYDSFEQEINWHMIGHLQRNKVKYLARMDKCKLIHSVDSLRLAKKINKRANMEDRQMNVLIQVNVAEDENKYGLMSEEVIDFLTEVSSFEYMKVKGLMTIAPYVDDPEEVRPYFRKLRELAVKIEAEKIPGVEMKELSMGMSNDLEVAIEEGATIVRVGSAIFGPRNYNK
ncbi:YggS family pyridoxal phosphate-dependent enzyme [Natroniella sulfidigena]|uniref:YggS family pyridoxal phosphate-dependent enzyme n=1 Tax=Natroniella sulfidigena TaxID=723921 RepID=UPI0024A71BDC|nr:YggS family pyridoxal phosphate-dependent enzyme [Natroniella sulfidigena]